MDMPSTKGNLPKAARSPARNAILELQSRIGKSVLGQDHLVESMLMGLLANGNLLIESLPGLAKTRAVKTLAKNLAADLSRFTSRCIVRFCSQHLVIGLDRFFVTGAAYGEAPPDEKADEMRKQGQRPTGRHAAS